MGVKRVAAAKLLGALSTSLRGSDVTLCIGDLFEGVRK